MTDLSLMQLVGGYPLKGSVNISGAKNAALPIMAAVVLSGGSVTLENLPLVDDILTLGTILAKLGVRLRISTDSATIDASEIETCVLPRDESKKMRASILVAGPMLAKFGKAVIVQPGGCVIGKRPINLHLEGFQALGAKVERMNRDHFRITADKLKGAVINLSFPSMGATENLLMAACLAEGKTVINNAAKEPEIVDLAVFLSKMGAKIKGAGTSVIVIDGVKELECIDYMIMPDRIEAGTYIMAAAITKGQVTVKNIIPEHLANVVDVLKKIGVHISVGSNTNNMVVEGQGRHKAANMATGPYPEFPTDLQPLLTSILSLSCGVSTLTDTVFPKRFCYVNQLKKLGADILVEGNSAKVKGVKNLFGADVYATDLRGGAAMVLSALAADGKTTISNCSQIFRGYENVHEKLTKLGAKVETVSDHDSQCISDFQDLNAYGRVPVSAE